MTTNLKRWLQAGIVCVLVALAAWLMSERTSGKAGVAHLILAIFTMVSALILTFHKVIGAGVFDRATTLAFLTGALWFGLQSVNSFVLHGVAPVRGLVWAGGCLIAFVFELRTMRWIELVEECDKGQWPTPVVVNESLPSLFPSGGYSADEDPPFGVRPPTKSGIPFMSQSPSDPLPTERGVYYPD